MFKNFNYLLILVEMDDTCVLPFILFFFFNLGVQKIGLELIVMSSFVKRRILALKMESVCVWVKIASNASVLKDLEGYSANVTTVREILWSCCHTAVRGFLDKKGRSSSS